MSKSIYESTKEKFMEYVQQNFKEELVENSEYLCEDLLTFMFKTKNGELHTLILDINSKEVKES